MHVLSFHEAALVYGSSTSPASGAAGGGTGGGALSGLGQVWRALTPVRAVSGAWGLGWAVGTAIHNPYSEEIQNGIDDVLN